MTTVALALAAGTNSAAVAETLDSVRSLVVECFVASTDPGARAARTLHQHLADRHLAGEVLVQPVAADRGPRDAALQLARERATAAYVLVLEAGEVLVGEPQLGDLRRDGYRLRVGERLEQWEQRLLRRSAPWRMDGVVDEQARCALPSARSGDVEGDYVIRSDRLDDPSGQPERWLAEAARIEIALHGAPDDPRLVFLLAQSLYGACRYERALAQYERRVRLGGCSEELYVARYRLAECMEWLERPWDESRAAYLECYLAHPDRAEPLVRVATCERQSEGFAAAQLCARRATRLSRPGRDALCVQRATYDFRALDELALASFAANRHEEAFYANARLLWSRTLPAAERPRIEANRDFSVPHIEQAFLRHDAELVRGIADRPSADDPRITLSVIASGGLERLARTVDSFLIACADLERIDRWICVDDGSREEDRREMQQRYPFFTFVFKDPADRGEAGTMNVLRDLIASPYRIDLPDGWHFFERLHYASLALDILDADQSLGQVLFNRHYAESLTERDVVGGETRFTGSGLRYLVHVHAAPGSAQEAAFWQAHPGARANLGWPHYALKPSLLRTTPLRELGPWDEEAAAAEATFARGFAAAGLRTAFFDTICCVRDRADEPR